LGSNIFYFSIWALFIAIRTKKTLKIIIKQKTKKLKKKKKKKTNECKRCYSINKSPKMLKKPKKMPNFEKAVSGRLLISLTGNHWLQLVKSTNR
jgi:hypothetical protein